MASETRIPEWTGASSRARLGFVAAVVAAASAVAVVSAALVGPDVPRLSETTSGDAALIERVEELLTDRAEGHDAVAVAVIDGDDVRFAGFGDEDDGGAVAESTAFEIGSVTKPMTGMLLADMIDDGEVDPESTLREVASRQYEIDGDGAEATLEALASHRAGYPRLPLSSLPASLMSSLAGSDPYTGSARTVLGVAAGVDAEPSDYSYSNLGVAALGDGLAAHQGTTYDDLLRERVLEPIGMDSTVAADSTATLPADRTSGRSAGGRDADEWLATGWQAAGIGTWSTTEDLAPARDRDHRRVGTRDGRTRTPLPTRGRPMGRLRLADHDDRRRGRADRARRGHRRIPVMVRDRPILRACGHRALQHHDARRRPRRSTAPRSTGSRFRRDGRPRRVAALAAVLLVGTIGSLIAVVRAAIRRRGDRHGLVRNVVNGIASVFVFTVVTPWHVVPDVVWVVAVAATLVTAVVVTLTWRRTPSTDTERPRLRWIGTATSVVIGAATIAIVAI